MQKPLLYYSTHHSKTLLTYQIQLQVCQLLGIELRALKHDQSCGTQAFILIPQLSYFPQTFICFENDHWIKHAIYFRTFFKKSLSNRFLMLIFPATMPAACKPVHHNSLFVCQLFSELYTNAGFRPAPLSNHQIQAIKTPQFAAIARFLLHEYSHKKTWDDSLLRIVEDCFFKARLYNTAIPGVAEIKTMSAAEIADKLKLMGGYVHET